MSLYVSQSTDIHTSVNTVAYHSIRFRIQQSTFYIPQSIQYDVQASYSACCNDPGISLGSQYDLFGINYWIEAMNNVNPQPDLPHHIQGSARVI
ncbi:TPA: hypothetical protein MHT75_25115 [Klebsiella pneumoniae]|nr:hypothetical protein [Klebsiella pneumoniae]HBX2817058.1 hypothetical protein [Klebsiella pneumoniae]